MTKLSETQLSLLAAADGREDGGFTRPSNLRPATAAKRAAKLIEHRLVREIRTKADMPVWREDDEGRKFSLIILKAGRVAVSAASKQAGAVSSAQIERQVEIAKTWKQAAAAPMLGTPGSKRALMVGLLQQPNGVTIKDLMAATGWLPHTTRAALTGLRKTGLAIERRQGVDMQGSLYRLASTKTTEAA